MPRTNTSARLALTGLIVDQLLSLGLPKAAADLCVRAERYCRTQNNTPNGYCD